MLPSLRVCRKCVRYLWQRTISPGLWDRTQCRCRFHPNWWNDYKRRWSTPSGVGTQYQGTVLEVAGYDNKNPLVTLLFHHWVGSWSTETWLSVFEELKSMDRFHIDTPTTLVDQERFIDWPFRPTMENTHPMLDLMDVKINIAPKLVPRNSKVPLFTTCLLERLVRKWLTTLSLNMDRSRKKQTGGHQGSYFKLSGHNRAP